MLPLIDLTLKDKERELENASRARLQFRQWDSLNGSDDRSSLLAAFLALFRLPMRNKSKLAPVLTEGQQPLDTKSKINPRKSA